MRVATSAVVLVTMLLVTGNSVAVLCHGLLGDCCVALGGKDHERHHHEIASGRSSTERSDGGAAVGSPAARPGTSPGGHLPGAPGRSDPLSCSNGHCHFIVVSPTVASASRARLAAEAAAGDTTGSARPASYGIDHVPRLAT